MTWTRTLAAHLGGSALAVGIIVGCGSSGDGGLGTIAGDAGLGALCCTDFKVGADLSGVDFGVDASIKGQFAAFAQAAGDLSAVATSSLEGVASACKAIATAGGANGDVESSVDAKEPKERVTAWCNLAQGRIESKLKAAGTLTIAVQAPACEASLTATADCQAGCTADASCQAAVKASPPRCTGGTLEVECSGDCTAAAGVTIDCQGKCQAQCSGSCTAEGGAAVDCDGTCSGTCAGGGASGGNGIQADGSCKGTCSGTCTMRANATVSCSGSCSGGCTGTCSADGTAKARCSGTCTADAQPIACKGGKLEASASCDVDAKCQANCNASAQAKAECTPPRVDVAFSGALDGEASAILEALRANLPNVFLVVGSRGKAFLDTVADVGASATALFDPTKLGVKGTACIATIAPVLVQAGENMAAAYSASVTIATSTGGL